MHCSLSRRCESARRAAGICSRGRLRSTPILLFPPSPHRRGMKKKKDFNLDLALLWLPGRSRQTRCRCRVLPYLGACPAAQTGHSQREFRDTAHGWRQGAGATLGRVVPSLGGDTRTPPPPPSAVGSSRCWEGTGTRGWHLPGESLLPNCPCKSTGRNPISPIRRGITCGSFPGARPCQVTELLPPVPSPAFSCSRSHSLLSSVPFPEPLQPRERLPADEPLDPHAAPRGIPAIPVFAGARGRQGSGSAEQPGHGAEPGLSQST